MTHHASHATVLRRALRRADEQLRRRRESVERLTELAHRDPDQWQELLDDAKARLQRTIEAASITAPIWDTPSHLTHVIVGDHTPEPRTS